MALVVHIQHMNLFDGKHVLLAKQILLMLDAVFMVAVFR